MKAAPSSCRESMKRMSLRPYISVMMLLVVVPTMPKVWSIPSARSISRMVRPDVISAMIFPSAPCRSVYECRASVDEPLAARLHERLHSQPAEGGTGSVGLADGCDPEADFSAEGIRVLTCASPVASP